MIEIVNLKKQFDSRWITNGVTLSIPNNQMTVIIGCSGAGKSVLLKQIIGLVRPTSGQVIVDNIDITNLKKKEFDSAHRKFGYVFQFAALLDSLTTFENVGITLLEQGIPESKVLPIVKEKLALVNLSQDILNKYPSELSGGMRKRVGFARTLIQNPDIILYDEPTTGLDPITTRVIHELMFDMQKKLNITSIIISHDVEIFNYADKVALLHHGKIVYHGDAKTVWNSENPYVFQFIRGLSEGPIQPDVTSHNFEK